jgi:phosphate transport system substrate-binding protein
MSSAARFAALVLGAALVAPFAAFADTSISAAGSTALLPLVKAAAGAYQSTHPGISISVTGGGSGVGIAQVGAKAVDMGDSDIVSSNPELIDHKVAVIGFAVITNPSAGVTNLTKKQLQDVYTGKVTNWKDVGGKDSKIVVINRPSSSGTRAVFQKTIMGSLTLTETGGTQGETGTVVTAVRTTPGATTYAAFSGTRAKDGIVEVSIEGVAPTDENVQSGKYPIWSYEHIYTNGAASTEVSRFIAFIHSSSGMLKQLGYIPVGDMKVSENDR